MNLALKPYTIKAPLFGSRTSRVTDRNSISDTMARFGIWKKAPGSYGSFWKLRIPYFGVRTIRILLFRVLYISFP